MNGDILTQILAYKRELVYTRKKKSKLKLSNIVKPIPFLSNFRKGAIFLIAELKKASPSYGIIREDFDPLSIARIYEEGGASAISVLTDEKYFLGSLDNLSIVSAGVSLPCLRKDFIIDPYQIEESFAYGASAILLIVRVLGVKELEQFISIGRDHYMESLVEVHNRDELAIALDAGASIIGINNRDLSSFKTNIDTTVSLIADIPDSCVVISESGISTREDIDYLRGFGLDAFLIGEAFMKERDIALKMRELIF